MSERSAAEIQRSHAGTASEGKPQMVHHETVVDDIPSDEDDEVSRLKATRKNVWDSDWKNPQGGCLGCGGNYHRSECRFKTAICRRCGRKGHLSRVCRASLPAYQGASPQVKPKQGARKMPSRRDECHAVDRKVMSADTAVSHASATVPTNKIYLRIHLEGVPLKMEVDTSSSRSLIAWHTLRRLLPKFAKRCLQPCPINLRDYQGNPIPIAGCTSLNVSFGTFAGRLPLIVVRDNLPSLLGLDWFAALHLDVSGIHTTDLDTPAQLFSEFADVFEGQLGKYTGQPISFNLDPQVAPVRLKPRRVPLALRPKVDMELDKLIAQGVLEPIEYSHWETPIVIPLKPDGSIRICADYKCTINKALQANQYPLPVVQQLLHSLGPGRVFVKLDLVQAYQQLPVDDVTAMAQAIVTHRGAFRCNRLQFGVSIAPGLFQGLMEQLLQGLPGVVPYFDDVLISAIDRSELVERLRAVLSCFWAAGLKLKKDKCHIGVPRVEFLGFLVDSNGIHPAPSKVEAIKNAPTPTNKGELQAFLGLLNFYSVFLPHKATLAEPLHKLLTSKAQWHWNQAAANAFQAVKDILASAAVLVQYDPCLPLSLTCDASPYGLGAVLSHQLPDGSEAPTAFYSRTLSAAERNYSQLDREALAAVAGIKRFHDYLYGRFFSLITDHKPLLGLLSGNKQTPQILSPRMSRWVEFLAAYSYQLIYKPGKFIGHADALSRCPLPMTDADPAPTSPILFVEDWDISISATSIRDLSARDPILSTVLDWVRRGWPRGQVAPSFQPFARRQHELSVLKGCLLWGNRVVVPPDLRRRILACLHDAHPGIVRMKALGHSYVWWPGMDQEIEAWVTRCPQCQTSRPALAAAPVRNWELPKTPWARVHVDFAGPFLGQTFLILVDAYSKWVDIVLTPSPTAGAVIRALDGLFATHGLPDVIVTDNGAQFTSAPFRQFLTRLDIRHATTAPYHPAGNGRAERAVQSAKEALGRLSSANWHQKICQYLLAQHTTLAQKLTEARLKC
ncbi:uncharacterized protein K02A2.6-like [Ahaetulla prasina]|uniref:uncharacterized protein K02A2.6-like n=1 Tax=Ahaetulla prasina TaxID=499056 RepID=UPI0026495BB6|nr:uncharacterized protein K02A2.6-like [Ahaetulla prasina]